MRVSISWPQHAERLRKPERISSKCTAYGTGTACSGSNVIFFVSNITISERFRLLAGEENSFGESASSVSLQTKNPSGLPDFHD